ACRRGREEPDVDAERHAGARGDPAERRAPCARRSESRSGADDPCAAPERVSPRGGHHAWCRLGHRRLCDRLASVTALEHSIPFMRTVRIKLVALVVACVAPAIAAAVLRSWESEKELLAQVGRRIDGANRRFAAELDEYQDNAKLALTLVE